MVRIDNLDCLFAFFQHEKSITFLSLLDFVVAMWPCFQISAITLTSEYNITITDRNDNQKLTKMKTEDVIKTELSSVSGALHHAHGTRSPHVSMKKVLCASVCSIDSQLILK